MASGSALALLQPLFAQTVENRLTAAGRRLVLTASFLIYLWAITTPIWLDPVSRLHGLKCIPGHLNSQILIGCIALLALEGLTGVAARFRQALVGAALALGGGVALAAGLQAAQRPALARPSAADPAASAPVAIRRAGDWTQWCGQPDRNMVSGEQGLPDRFDQLTKDATSGLANVRWVVRLGTQTFGSPVISGGKVFIGGVIDGPQRTQTGALWCFRESDGALLWRMLSPYPPLLYNRISYGFCSTPTVENDRLYLLGHLGDVLCLSANGMADGNKGPFLDEAQYFASDRKRTRSEIAPDGQRLLECTPGTPAALGPLDADILWKFDMLHQVNCWPFNALNPAILIRGDRLYVATSSTLSGHGDEGSAIRIREWKRKYHQTTYDSPSLIVLDKHTGRLLARDREGIFDRTFHGAHSSPALGVVNGKELLFYGGGDGACYAFDPEFRPGPDGQPGELKLVWKFDCLAPETLESKFRPNRELNKAETVATPVFYKNRVYTSIGNDLERSGPAAGPGRLVCLDATQTGEINRTGKIWSFDEIRSTASTVAIADGLLYTGDAAGQIYCLNADTGQVYWTHAAAPVWGSPLVADGKVFVGTHLGGLLVFAHGREKKLLSQNLGKADIVASPTAANGVLYVATQQHLYALELGKKGGLAERPD